MRYRGFDGVRQRHEYTDTPPVHIVVAAREMGGYAIGGAVFVPGVGEVGTVSDLVAAESALQPQQPKTAQEEVESDFVE